MPSLWHDAITRMIGEQPRLAVTIMRDLLAVDAVPSLAAHSGPEVFNTRVSRDLVADRLVLVGQPHAPSHVLVVEVQQDRLADKLARLAAYAAAAWLEYDCPADVLVICPDEATAAWYARPVVTGIGGSVFVARVLWPGLVPVITDPAVVVAEPGLAVLSLAFHGQDQGVVEAFLGGIAALEAESQADYYEYGFGRVRQGRA